MSESFASQYMTPEEKQAMITNDPQSAQALSNEPRVGFAHNCYAGGLGMFFQRTIKNTVIEKLLKTAWDGMLKYRCSGSRAAYRAAKQNPDAVFQYDDPLLAALNRIMKESIVEHHTDADAARKRGHLVRATDIVLTLLHEDIYYRARFRLHLKDVLVEVQQRPEWLELSPAERENVERWNGKWTK